MTGYSGSGLGVASGSTVDLTGTATIDPSTEISGPATIYGPGTMNIIKRATISLSGTGFNDGLQFHNYGTVSGSGADICQNGAPTVVNVINEPKGKMSLTAGSFSSGCGEPQPSGIVVNDAKATFSVVSGTFTIGVPFDNLGKVSVASGVLSVDKGNSGNNGTDSGTYSTKSTKKATGEIAFNSARNLELATLNGSGTFGFNAEGGGLNLADPTLASVVQTGTTSGGMIITKSLQFDYSETDTLTQTDSGSPTTTEIKSGATITFTSAARGAYFTGGHQLVIDAGGNADNQGDGICLDGGSTITNSGTWTFSSGGGDVSNCASGSSSMTTESTGSVADTASGNTSAIDVPFTNQGNVDVSAGSLVVTGPATDTGSWTVANGTTLYFAGGTSTVTGSFTAPGTVQVYCYATLGLSGQHLTNLVLGGYTSGDYSLAGALTFTGFPACNNLPTINIPSGSVSLAGNYVPTPNQEQPVLQVTVSGASSFGQLQVAGSATLSGDELQVTTASGFTPTLGESFQILTAGTTSGNFTLEGNTCAGSGLAYQSVPDANGISLNVIADSSC
jgi:hypothetical protein